MIHFNCPACGASFDVDDRFAGRKGRCKACGSPTVIPARAAAARPREPVGAAAGPRLTPIEPETARRPQPSVMSGRPLNWLEAVNSQVALAPISQDGLPSLKRRPTPLDEPSFDGPYRMATAPSLPALKSAAGKPAGAMTREYRHLLGMVQKLFRWINESAYLVSTPFLILALMGLVGGSHWLLVLGGTGVVLLNIGRVVAGVANLVVIPFRESPVKGLLFLLPPVTVVYLAQNWPKVRRPVKRIVGPILTILMVGLAFVAWPWLHGDSTPRGSIRDQVEGGFRTATDEIKKKASRASDLNLNDVGKLKSETLDVLKNLKGNTP